ncbi:hypothetical protein SFC43_13300 [Bacteroides sp. CR5/BHMF/2]|nr:hypothetical protein [Bacteroides sp. CR5/BHMF/2]
MIFLSRWVEARNTSFNRCGKCIPDRLHPDRQGMGTPAKQYGKAKESRMMREIEARQEAEYRQNIQKKKDSFRRTDEWLERRAKKYEYYEKAKVERILRQEREQERRDKREAAQLPAGNGNRNGNRNVTPPILYVICRDRLPQVKVLTEANVALPLTACNIPAVLPSVTCHW